MALSNYYYSIKVYRKSIATDDFGNESEDGAPWIENQTILGMIQPKDGSRVERNNDDLIVSDYLLYTSTTVEALNTDRIYFGGRFYEITNMKVGTGVYNKQHHQEWDLKRIDDNEV
jgi:hypothetical protein